MRLKKVIFPLYLPLNSTTQLNPVYDCVCKYVKLYYIDEDI